MHDPSLFPQAAGSRWAVIVAWSWCSRSLPRFMPIASVAVRKSSYQGNTFLLQSVLFSKHLSGATGCVRKSPEPQKISSFSSQCKIGKRFFTRAFAETLREYCCHVFQFAMRDHELRNKNRSRAEAKAELNGVHSCVERKERKNSMNNTFFGASLVDLWRDGGGQNNPAGPLFAAGEFAESDIVNATAKQTGCCLCTGSHTSQCC